MHEKNRHLITRAFFWTIWCIRFKNNGACRTYSFSILLGFAFVAYWNLYRKFRQMVGRPRGSETKQTWHKEETYKFREKNIKLTSNDGNMGRIYCSSDQDSNSSKRRITVQSSSAQSNLMIVLSTPIMNMSTLIIQARSSVVVIYPYKYFT